MTEEILLENKDVKITNTSIYVNSRYYYFNQISSCKLEISSGRNTNEDQEATHSKLLKGCLWTFVTWWFVVYFSSAIIRLPFYLIFFSTISIIIFWVNKYKKYKQIVFPLGKSYDLCFVYFRLSSGEKVRYISEDKAFSIEMVRVINEVMAKREY